MLPETQPLVNLMAIGRLSVDEVVRIGRSVAEALPGIHGELTPSAIEVGDDSVSIHPPYPARVIHYSAPERLLGRPATAASDVFSIGAIMFHALSGRPPFRGETARELMLSVEPPADLRALRPETPEPVVQIIYRCLMREPVQRYATPAELAAALAAVGRKSWPGRRVLVADDDAPVRALYQRVVQRAGVEADIVSSGRDAINAIKTTRYDVVFLDLNMPRLSGWEVLDFLRNSSVARPQRLFIVTGFSDQRISDADRELVAGVVYKPFATEELTALLIQCLRGGTIDFDALLPTTGHRALA